MDTLGNTIARRYEAFWRWESFKVLSPNIFNLERLMTHLQTKVKFRIFRQYQSKNMQATS